MREISVLVAKWWSHLYQSIASGMLLLKKSEQSSWSAQVNSEVEIKFFATLKLESGAEAPEAPLVRICDVIRRLHGLAGGVIALWDVGSHVCASHSFPSTSQFTKCMSVISGFVLPVIISAIHLRNAVGCKNHLFHTNYNVSNALELHTGLLSTIW